MAQSKKISIQNMPILLLWSKAWSSPSGLTDKTKAVRKKNRAQLECCLKSKLKGARVFSSLSHTEMLGAFAVAPSSVGVDVESARRKLSKKALIRLGHEQEHTLFPKPIQLWVAKEAAWKAFYQHNGFKQPKVIAQIEILHAFKNGRLIFSVPCSLYAEKKFYGRIYLIDGHFIAVATLTS